MAPTPQGPGPSSMPLHHRPGSRGYHRTTRRKVTLPPDGFRATVHSRVRLSGLLETFGRIGVWPDSVLVPVGFALYWAAHPLLGVLSSGLQPAGHRDEGDEAWLKSASVCQAAHNSGRCWSASNSAIDGVRDPSFEAAANFPGCLVLSDLASIVVASRTAIGVPG